MIDHNYALEIMKALGRVERTDPAAFRRATQLDVNAVYRAEVEHVYRVLFAKPMERDLEHKCSSGASDTADTGLQRPDPA